MRFTPNQTSIPGLRFSSTHLRLDYDNQFRPKEASWRLVLTPWKPRPQVLLQVAGNSWHAKTNIQIIPTLVFKNVISSRCEVVKLCLFATPQIAVCQASLSFTTSPSLLKLTFTESVMPSDHLILSCKEQNPCFQAMKQILKPVGFYLVLLVRVFFSLKISGNKLMTNTSCPFCVEVNIVPTGDDGRTPGPFHHVFQLKGETEDLDWTWRPRERQTHQLMGHLPSEQIYKEWQVLYGQGQADMTSRGWKPRWYPHDGSQGTHRPRADVTRGDEEWNRLSS